MRVTKDMETELGAGPGSLLELADILGEDGTGVKITTGTDGMVRVKVDSTAYPSKSAWLEPDDADALGDLIKAKAADGREIRGAEQPLPADLDRARLRLRQAEDRLMAFPKAYKDGQLGSILRDLKDALGSGPSES